MQKIIPHLWFDKQAKEAAEFYVAAFGSDSKITNVNTLHDTPSGDADTVSFEIWGYQFMSISAGPYFTINPAISISVQCHNEEELLHIYNILIVDGEELVPLDTYSWSKKYVMLKDRYGLAWQLNLPNDQNPIIQRINPSLMFSGNVCGKAEEAITHYTSIFPHSRIDFVAKYGSDENPNTEGTIKHAEFILHGEHFMALDSADDHDFNFNEAVSFLVNCETQEEIDHYWEKLSAVPEAEQCGWLKDKFGVSWQIVPTEMDEMMASSNPEKVARVTQAFLKMKKFDIAELQKAYEGK